MRTTKAFFTILIATSFSIASISGKVTTTSGAAVSGATVKLEKGGPSATTGADGTFSLSVSTAILPGKQAPGLPSNLSAKIQNGSLVLTTIERKEVEITTLNLQGNTLAKVQKTINAGTNTIELSNITSHIYFFIVKSGRDEIILKGNSIFGRVQSTGGSTGHFPSNQILAKQAQTAIAINEVLTVTKTGFLNYKVSTFNSDTSGLVIKLIASAGTVTDADGNVYQTVKLGTQEWMAENLRTTKYRDGTPIPLDTSTTAWSVATTPKFCFYNNTTNVDSIKKLGALYNWFVVNPANTNLIAPAGWHVPSDSERAVLQDYLIAQGFNWDKTTVENRIAKSMAGQVAWAKDTALGVVGNDMTKNNTTGFSGFPAGTRDRDGLFSDYGISGAWWCGPQRDKQHSFRFLLFSSFDNLFETMIDKKTGHSVRLVRD